VEIVDNWNVVGMRGTGSYDLRLHKKRVDDTWTFVRGAAATIDEPLYRYPAVSYQAQVHSAVNLGLARAALDLVTAMAGGTKTLTGAPRLGDRGYYRAEIGKAEAMLRSARAFFYEATAQAWNSILAGDPVSPGQANLLRLSAARSGADAVQKAYRIAGTASIYSDNRLQWIMRDSLVVTQHHFLSESTYDSAGALFAGIPPGTPYP
jgi:indole-3-acetate monooxygenase